MPQRTSGITQVLNRAAAGDVEAAERLWSLVYDELRRIARRELRKELPGQTLSTTGLVHEAYFKFSEASGVSFQGRQHFCAVACRAMRQILVDRARRRNAQKRVAGRDVVTLDSAAVVPAPEEEDLVALDEALERLAAFNPRLGQVVECHFFGRLSFKETADVLGSSLRTVERDWGRAKAYLYRFLRPDPV